MQKYTCGTMTRRLAFQASSQEREGAVKPSRFDHRPWDNIKITGVHLGNEILLLFV